MPRNGYPDWQKKRPDWLGPISTLGRVIEGLVTTLVSSVDFGLAIEGYDSARVNRGEPNS